MKTNFQAVFICHVLTRLLLWLQISFGCCDGGKRLSRRA